jgi:hypothetical protein
MPIRVECPQCHDVTHFADNDAGLAVACLACGRHLRVPTPMPVPVPVPAKAKVEDGGWKMAEEPPLPSSVITPSSASPPPSLPSSIFHPPSSPSSPPAPRRPIRPAPGRGKWRTYLLLIGLAGGALLAFVLRPRHNPQVQTASTSQPTTIVTAQPATKPAPAPVVAVAPAPSTKPTLAAVSSPPIPPPPHPLISSPYTPPAAPVGFVGLERVEINGSIDVDSYNGATGAYVRGPARTTPVLLSNGPITFVGRGEIRGGVRPGERNPLKPAKHVDITGPTACLTGPLPVPTVRLDPFAHDSANAALPADAYRKGNLSVASGRTVVLPAGVYYLNDVTVDAGGTLRCAGPVTLLVSGKLSVAGKIETRDSRPAHCRVRVTGSQPVTIAHHNTLFLDCYAPQSNVDISGRGDLFGSVVGRTLRVTGDRPLHVDESLAIR